MRRNSHRSFEAPKANEEALSDPAPGLRPVPGDTAWWRLDVVIPQLVLPPAARPQRTGWDSTAVLASLLLDSRVRQTELHFTTAIA